MSEINEELISAYLDHELSTEEREMVEAALARNPRLRQLKGDLEKLHNDFDLLPVYRSEDIQHTISQTLNQAKQTPVLTTRKAAKETTSGKKLWLSAGIGFTACLLLTVTLLYRQNNDAEQIAMSDSSSILPSEKVSDLADQLLILEDPESSTAGEEGEMNDAVGGVTEDLSAEVTTKNDGAGAMAELAEESGVETKKLFAEADSLNPSGATALARNSKMQTQIKADQIIHLSVTKNQLVELLATLDPPPTPRPTKAKIVQESIPQQRKPAANRSDNQSKRENPILDQRSNALVFTVERTPEELVKLITRLQSSKYLSPEKATNNTITKKTNDHYADLVKNKPGEKLRVLFLIKVQAESEAE
ncbi:MAG: hypothetical protein CMJ76_05150 [Planctomycetaceae bacterium]|nr:hypothetical protein [Planctomycetaceae bacterium]|tara:strand:+ start:2695 stop:3780 length:1086 start_codon:yes stop_codon:yes gene_type:complete